jgi:hypothetical protein
MNTLCAWHSSRVSLSSTLPCTDNQHAHYVTKALQQWIEGEVASADGGGGEEEEEFPGSE